MRDILVVLLKTFTIITIEEGEWIRAADCVFGDREMCCCNQLLCCVIDYCWVSLATWWRSRHHVTLSTKRCQSIQHRDGT